MKDNTHNNIDKTIHATTDNIINKTSLNKKHNSTDNGSGAKNDKTKTDYQTSEVKQTLKAPLFIACSIASIILSFILASTLDQTIPDKEATKEGDPVSYQPSQEVTGVMLHITKEQDLSVDINIKFKNYSHSSKQPEITVQQTNQYVDANEELELDLLTWQVDGDTVTIDFDKVFSATDKEYYGEQLTLTLPTTMTDLSIAKQLKEITTVNINNDNTPIDLKLTTSYANISGNYNTLTINNLNEGCGSYTDQFCFNFLDNTTVEKLVIRNMVTAQLNTSSESLDSAKPYLSKQSSVLLNDGLVANNIELYMNENAAVSITNMALLKRIKWHKID